MFLKNPAEIVRIAKTHPKGDLFNGFFTLLQQDLRLINPEICEKFGRRQAGVFLQFIKTTWNGTSGDADALYWPSMILPGNSLQYLLPCSSKRSSVKVADLSDLSGLNFACSSLKGFYHYCLEDGTFYEGVQKGTPHTDITGISRKRSKDFHKGAMVGYSAG